MIPLSSLGGLGPQLGEPGGQGVVHESGRDPDTLIKRYLPTAQIDPGGLQRLVDWRDQLPGNDRAVIDAHTSWPTAVVDLGGGQVGVTFRRAPAAFFHTVEGEHAPRKISWAFQEKECRWVGLTPLSPVNSWILLGRIMRTFEVLHRHGVAYRDISNANLFFDGANDPTPFIIDCDSAHVLSGPPGLSGEPITMGYECPLPLRGIDLDLWKLGMLCDRVGLYFTGVITATTTRLRITGGRPASPDYVSAHRALMTGTMPLPSAADLAGICNDMVDGLRQRGYP